MKLTPKQIRFIDEYLVDFNATQAAIRAGYKAKNAYQIGSENLKKPQIQAEITRRQKDLQNRTEISQDRVVKELARIAFADVTDYAKVKNYTLDKGGLKVVRKMVSVVRTTDLTDDQRAAIAGIKEGANGIEIKLHDKIKALELLGRHIGMFNDKLALSGTDGGPLTFKWDGDAK